jgi:two-component sensor histidine kinase
MFQSARFCTILLLFAAQFLFAQQDDFDKLSIDSTLVWLTNNIVNNPDHFHATALKTLDRAYESGDDQLKGKAHLLLMRWHYYFIPFTIDSIYDHGEKALVLFKRANDQLSLAATSAELGDEYTRKNDSKRAEELIFDAIDIYEELGAREELGAVYRKLASVFLSQNEPELSIKYGLNAVEIAEETDNTFESAMSWMGLIRAYHENGEKEKAIEAGDKCIAIANNYLPNEKFLLAKAHAYRGDVWLDLGKYQEALVDNRIAHDTVAAQLGVEHNATKTFRQGIGHAYYLEGNYKAAIPHLVTSIEGYAGDGQDRKPALLKVYDILADSYSQIGDFENAYKNQKIIQEISDTATNKRIANLESEALFKYESGKKDQAIAEQATIIQQNDRIQTLGIGFIVLLLLFLSTLFYYFRRNKKIANDLSIKNQENELLLKEIHHRVKNNLQTISSLLSLQSESISDKNALNAVQESKNRVASMALIHQKLYQGENLAAIEMRDYFETIGKAIKDSFGEKAKNVSLEVDMSEIELDVDTAIPIGLITNELITNSLKHAFQNKDEGEILITLSQEENGLLNLRIADNGQASENKADVKKESGFGSLLIQLLTTQLGGTLKKSNESGTSTMIQFPIQEKSAA